MFRVTVDEILPNLDTDSAQDEVERYSQLVDRLDLLRLIEIINAKPPRIRQRKPKDAP